MDFFFFAYSPANRNSFFFCEIQSVAGVLNVNCRQKANFFFVSMCVCNLRICGKYKKKLRFKIDYNNIICRKNSIQLNHSIRC